MIFPFQYTCISLDKNIYSQFLFQQSPDIRILDNSPDYDAVHPSLFCLSQGKSNCFKVLLVMFVKSWISLHSFEIDSASLSAVGASLLWHFQSPAVLLFPSPVPAETTLSFFHQTLQFVSAEKKIRLLLILSTWSVNVLTDYSAWYCMNVRRISI